MELKNPEYQDPMQWHLDKRVPLGIIIVILAQTIALVWWAATLTGQVETNTMRLNDHIEAPAHSDVAARLARLEGRQDLILTRLTEIAEALRERPVAN